MTDYVALQPIDAGGVRAYSAGDPVPGGNVEANGYVVGEQVAVADSEQAVTVLRDLGILPAPDAEPDESGGDVEATDATFDPEPATVEQVNEWLDEHPDEADRVLALEAGGKHRSGIMHGRHGTQPDVAEG